MKRLFLILLCALLTISIVVAIILVSCSNKYTIADNKGQLEDNIKQIINRPDIVTDKIEIKQELNLDNKKYVLFVINNSLGRAEFTKGFNNKYEIDGAGYGGGSYYCAEVFKTNKGKYLIMTGVNYNMKIAYSKVLLEGNEYKISIPQQEYFIAYSAVPIETISTHPDPQFTKLYDKNDTDITDDMFKLILKYYFCINYYMQK